MDLLIAVLATFITIHFSYNFGKIISKIKGGKEINKFSLLTTSALILHFASVVCLAVYDNKIFLLASLIYVQICLLFLTKKG
jgi:membrane-anchored glycerophosphoryl diester phosphodiesterase (GDPDase)